MARENRHQVIPYWKIKETVGDVLKDLYLFERHNGFLNEINNAFNSLSAAFEDMDGNQSEKVSIKINPTHHILMALQAMELGINKVKAMPYSGRTLFERNHPRVASLEKLRKKLVKGALPLEAKAHVYLYVGATSIEDKDTSKGVETDSIYQWKRDAKHLGNLKTRPIQWVDIKRDADEKAETSGLTITDIGINHLLKGVDTQQLADAENLEIERDNQKRFLKQFRNLFPRHHEEADFFLKVGQLFKQLPTEELNSSFPFENELMYVNGRNADQHMNITIDNNGEMCIEVTVNFLSAVVPSQGKLCSLSAGGELIVDGLGDKLCSDQHIPIIETYTKIRLSKDQEGKIAPIVDCMTVKPAIDQIRYTSDTTSAETSIYDVNCKDRSTCEIVCVDLEPNQNQNHMGTP